MLREVLLDSQLLRITLRFFIFLMFNRIAVILHYHLQIKMSSGVAHNTRLGSMRQDLPGLKDEFKLQMSSLKSSTDSKFEDIYHRLSSSDLKHNCCSH